MNQNSLRSIAIVSGIIVVLGIVLIANYWGGPANSLATEACAKDFADQTKYLNDEKYSDAFKFENYPVPSGSDTAAAPLDQNSSKYTYEFRTRLQKELADKGINFAGHYSLVRVGVAGWGDNYWIIDRKTRKAFEFPYHAVSLDFKKDSSLIVMNSKDTIRRLFTESDGGCYYYNQQKVNDLRPFYFEWKNGVLTKLAPIDLVPPVNTFWIDYTNGTTEDISPALAHFIREVKKQIILDTGRVPQGEGYTGFMLIEAFPGIVPEDFTGVTTPYGNFLVENGKLQFVGNAPSNAADMTIEGIGVLFQNIAKRLSMPRDTVEDVEKILVKISLIP